MVGPAGHHLAEPGGGDFVNGLTRLLGTGTWLNLSALKRKA